MSVLLRLMSLCLVVPIRAGHICNSGIHYFVEHSMKCPHNDDAKRELLGCNLFDFTLGKRFSRFSDQQVHWPGGVQGLDHFMYTQHNNVPGHTTCLMASSCNQNGERQVTDGKEKWYEQCYGTTHEEFNMPDYCSRAIVSELSTVYNGVDRVTSIRAGAKVLFSNADKQCFWHRSIKGTNTTLNRIFQEGTIEKACWNQANDWRKLYCVKYSQCKCPDDMTAEECHFNPAKVQCCKSLYREFLQSERHVYKGNPLSKSCLTEKSLSYTSLIDRAKAKGTCRFNPISGRQRDFTRQGRQDFSRLY